ncbi:MAG: sterol desaturase family protein [Candidatus Rokuibacteriota bacterium]
MLARPETAYRWGAPDGPLGVASAALNLPLAAYGDGDRAVHRPWVPLLAAGKAAVDAVASAWYFYQMPAREKAWGGYCIAGAVANVAVFALTVPEPSGRAVRCGPRSRTPAPRRRGPPGRPDTPPLLARIRQPSRRPAGGRRPMTRTGSLALGGLVAGAFLGLLLAERRRPLRPRVEPPLPHTGRNLVVAGLGAVATGLTEWAVGQPVARWAGSRRVGLLRALPLPARLASLLGFLLLDYTLWLWHRWNHHAPFLWRFHVVHHVDRDLDASTGVRFHFGELALSTGFRAGQLTLLGVDRDTFAAYQAVLILSVLFHHSNLRLPLSVERRLVPLVVTPRMHGIHHSVVERETDGNFSSLFTCWDRLHGTLRLDAPHDEITVGVPAYRSAAETRLTRVLALPFEPQRPSWEFPDGERPGPGHATGAP